MQTQEMTQMAQLIESEAAGLHDFLGRLSTEEWSRPSACAGWTVGDVVAHLTQSAYTWSEGITRARAGDASPPPGQQPLRPGERGSEATAQRAIELRQEKGEAELLQTFADGYAGLYQVLQQLGPEDWDKRCFHRRGVLLVRDYVGLRVQELTIHGWDIRSAFDGSAEPSEQAFSVLVSMVPRWLNNTFTREVASQGSVSYRFDVPGPVPVHQDVLVEGEKFRTAPVSSRDPDVTFHCNTGNYLLLIYGRLELDQAIAAGRLAVEGDLKLAARFNELFRGV